MATTTERPGVTTAPPVQQEGKAAQPTRSWWKKHWKFLALTAVGLIAVVAVAVVITRGSGDNVSASPPAALASPADGPVAAPVAPPAASAPVAPVAPAPQTSAPPVPPGMLVFNSVEELGRAVFAGTVPYGAQVQVSGQVNRFTGLFPFRPSGIMLVYLPDPKPNIYGQLNLRGMSSMICSPKAGSLFDLSGIGEGERISVRGILHSIGILEKDSKTAVAQEFRDCTIVSR